MIKEIIDKGHDQDEFTEFMRKRRLELDGNSAENLEEKALDIDQWTFEELDEAVRAFKELDNTNVKEEMPNHQRLEEIDPSFSA